VGCILFPHQEHASVLITYDSGDDMNYVRHGSPNLAMEPAP
jgi:hypothetical protein